MTEQSQRFLLKVPAAFFTMSDADQESAAVAMWRDAMVQLGKDPDKFVSEAASVSGAPANG